MNPSAAKRWDGCISAGFTGLGDRAIRALETAHRDGRREAFEEAARICDLEFAANWHADAIAAAKQSKRDAALIRARMEEQAMGEEPELRCGECGRFLGKGGRCRACEEADRFEREESM